MSRAAKLLTFCLDTRTPANERDNALIALTTMFERVGGVERMFEISSPAIPEPILSFNEARREKADFIQRAEKAEARVSDLEKRLATQTATLTAARQEIEILKNSVTSKRTHDGSMPYMQFSNHVRILLGTQRWRQQFIEQTGIDSRRLDKAASNKVAPKDLVDLIPKLRKEDTRHKAQIFTTDHVKQIREWWPNSFEEIANKATRSFGYVVTEQMIRKLRFDVNGRRGIYSDPAYGGNFPPRKGTLSVRRSFENTDHFSEETKALEGQYREVAEYCRENGGGVTLEQIEKGLPHCKPRGRVISRLEQYGWIRRTGSYYIYRNEAVDISLSLIDTKIVNYLSREGHKKGSNVCKALGLKDDTKIRCLRMYRNSPIVRDDKGYFSVKANQ